ncbi:prolyl oligopeptidase family serine peptidase [Yersinia ruckeri]|uniref:Phospholipase A n=1 Tax=Yersinia ruckeri TaxID=29486 RepID=A0A085UA80_YERRU|nr:prolyl oligopeptidase family serine peptidase [Yersinia ruckeri]AKA38017.1 phospholipase A [Yersinia ruckeri]ARZ00141.1 phospholipase A [Yersinia ruckeri]EKN3346214.1 DUF2974 domain-containing protein [Yersinia ruckeri]EKN3361776.1 DUF2974 domain-containing protein [Yersinia ruckeri]EKN4182248.1 DUF2974 domain-containing protein [Yersinia ruckeri]
MSMPLSFSIASSANVISNPMIPSPSIKVASTLSETLPVTSSPAPQMILTAATQGANDLYQSMMGDLSLSRGELAAVKSAEMIGKGKASQQSDYSLALMAKDVYAPSGANLDGFQRVSDEALLKVGIDPASLSDRASGFQAGIYSNQQQYVLAFAGTNDMQDWLSNIRQATGYDDIQYNQAVALGKTAKMAFGDSLVITGHSLGGGLAATAALATATFAVTFNAAGVSDHTMNRLGINPVAAKKEAESGAIRRYSEQYDMLTDTQESTPLIPDAIGHKITLANDEKLTGLNDWRPSKHLERRLTAHGIDKVLSSMSEQKPWELKNA